MSEQFDLVIRGGTIVDGTGAAPFVGDVAVKDGKIVAVGAVEGTGREEVDASGKIVTPGFVDVHTHYDGQAIWSDRLNPSSAHGVTTAMIGNCGVGFAPCRQEDHEVLIEMMEGVEDIPGAVMAEGLDWTWETFPQFLDALESRNRDIDVVALLPHSPLRVYAMGERGARREPATEADLARMADLAAEAARAGAIGISTSRTQIHRTVGGELIPSYEADYAELEHVLRAMNEAGAGPKMLQAVPGDAEPDDVGPFSDILSLVERVGAPATFTMGFGNAATPRWFKAKEMIDRANAQGTRVTAQVHPKPVGMIIGLDMTTHPFSQKPSYREIAHLPLAERLAEMRKPERKRKILSDGFESAIPLHVMGRAFDRMFPMQEPPVYEPNPDDSVATEATRRGVSPEEAIYDMLIEGDGSRMFLVALANFPDKSLDAVGEAMKLDHIVPGLGDGGAHYGMICDAAYPTFMLQHWVRDRQGSRLPLERAIRLLTGASANALGLTDRGVLAAGKKADINIIDLEAIALHVPTVVRDLPAGGSRLNQLADGYVATYVSGQCIARNGNATAARPGRLVRAGVGA